MTAYINNKGETHQLPLGLTMYREAFDNGLSFEQYVNMKYPDADPKRGSTFQQMLASENIFVQPNKEYGIRASTMDYLLNGPRGEMAAGGTILKEGVPASRILFPAVFLSVIEDKLVADLSITPNAFETMIAVDDTIASDRFERPVINFSKPEAARHQVITQMALPNTMLSITAADISKKIPTFSLGVEVSDQATRATTIDLVGLALARQAMVERSERAQGYIQQLLNGDTDNGIGPLSGVSGKVVTATSFDPSIGNTAGKLTQVAWINWLWKNHTKRRITHIVTDLAGAMSIENRANKPIITGDNPNSPRIDAIPTLMNPGWDFNTKIFITDDTTWPVNTLMGFDARYAVHRVKSLTASYEAVEQLVMRRATQFRFDFGEIVYRLFDDAFEVMTLT
jgi:hypothetical protein